MSFKLKITLPAKLPPASEGITPVDFETWKDKILVYLKQSKECRLFFTGGKYGTWTAAVKNPNRIVALHAEDQPGENDDPAEFLEGRRIELDACLCVIAGVVHSSQYKDVMRRSTSLEWIWNQIEVDYNLQKKGRHFLKIDAITFNPAGAEAPVSFYKRFRGFFEDNLRKRGERVASEENVALAADEAMSPSLENTIVYMALKQIDPRLPTQIDKIFGHRMNADVTLFDLSGEIFQNAAETIAEMDKESFNSIGQEEYVPNVGDQVYAMGNEPVEEQQQASLCAWNGGYGRGQFRPRGGNFRPTGGMGFRPRMQQRFQNMTPRPNFRRQMIQQAPRFQNYQNFQSKFCSLCRDAGSPALVVRSHNMNQCQRLSKSTVSQMRSMVLDEDVDPDYYPDTEAPEGFYEETS